MKTQQKTIVATLLALAALPLTTQAAVGVDWDQTTTFTSATGTLGSTSFSLTNFSFVNNGTADMTTANYDAAPLTSSQEVMLYAQGADWNLTLSQPTVDLLLYARFWRPGTYQFNQAFTLLDGSGATATNAITLTVSGFFDGILKFNGPISNLSLTDNAPSGNSQGVTFGTAVPEPTSLAMLGLGALGLLGRRNRAASR